MGLPSICLALCIAFLGCEGLSDRTFPSNFKFGVGTSAYQIEGAWNIDGKGESMWDRWIHENVDKVVDKSTGDVACDSYHKVEEDVQLLKTLGVDYYRFSLSWPRILPDGTPDNINQLGVDYYMKLIQLLEDNNIEPLVTLYHWDLPQPLNELGGWLNDTIVDYFADYARVCFKLFGHKVKNWATLNEPKSTCFIGYGSGVFAPGINSMGIGLYKCAYTSLKAHARVYHLYQDEFKATQNGTVSIVLDGPWAVASDATSEEHLAARDQELYFDVGLFANAIYSKEGNWPQVIIDRVAKRSQEEGFPVSRLPAFTEEEIEYIKGTSDYYSLNYYTSYVVEPEDEPSIGEPNFYLDKGTTAYQNESWPLSASSWLRSYPEGLRYLVKWIDEQYNHPEIVITECGWSDKGELQDQPRIDYYADHLSNILDAIYEDNVKVTGFTAWSFMDNFEWMQGYSERFGMIHVDFEDDNRTRTLKDSAYWFQKVIATKCLTESCS